jgi:HK97 family phage portal protein
MQVKVDRETTGQKRLVYKILNEKGAADGTYTVDRGKPHDILHIKGLSPDGIKGYSVIEVGRQVIGSALAAERHIATFWANGGRGPYYLERPTEFKDEESAKAWRSKWEERMRRGNTPPIITDGTKYHDISKSLRDSQGIENRSFVTQHLCDLFDINPTLVGDASRATFSNHEQYMLQFVRMTLQKHYTRWEQAFKLHVLTPDEREQGYFLRHDIRTLLRGDFQTQMAGFATALQNGYMNIDEVRDQLPLPMNPLPNGAGSRYHIQINMGELPDDRAASSPQPLAKGLVRIA